jgi:phosphonate C-P lyase system protein PhnG
MMDHSEIIAEASPEAVREIAELISGRLPVKVLKSPSPGMVMVQHAEPIENTVFLLGETFVTECEVEVDGQLGYACVLGSGRERALCGAMVDAIMGGRHVFERDITPLLEAEQKKIEARWDMESRAVASTRVSFEVR